MYLSTHYKNFRLRIYYSKQPFAFSCQWPYSCRCGWWRRHWSVNDSYNSIKKASRRSSAINCSAGIKGRWIASSFLLVRLGPESLLLYTCVLQPYSKRDLRA